MCLRVTRIEEKNPNEPTMTLYLVDITKGATSKMLKNCILSYRSCGSPVLIDTIEFLFNFLEIRILENK